MTLRKIMTKILCRNLEKRFLEWEKLVSRKVFRHFLHEFFHFYIISKESYVRFFSINLELICTCEFFKKLKSARAIFEDSLVKINSKLNSKPYDYLY